jgi:hypothetical protein
MVQQSTTKINRRIKFKKLVTNKNIRNLKDKVKIDKLNINYDKMLLKKRNVT